jgi:hypothetical protein
VQGVGFRATWRSPQLSYERLGEESGGRPCAALPGRAGGSVETFLKAVRDRWKDNIKNEQIEKRDAQGFTIVK